MKHKVENIENKIQFCVVLGMFMPVLLEALFDVSKSNNGEGSSVIMKYGIIVFFLIVNYLVFDWRKERFTSRQLDYINWVFVTMISCFAVVVLFLALITNGNLNLPSAIVILSFPAALTGILYMPLISLAIMTLSFFKDR